MTKRILCALIFSLILGSIYLSTAGLLYAQTLAGDANADGVVDGLDYLVWSLHYHRASINGVTDGDFDVNGAVDGIDFVIWNAAYGRVVTTTPTNTPLPTGNLALHKPVLSSSIDDPSRPPQNAVDGDSLTRWSSGWAQPEWIQIDLGARYSISRVILQWQRSYGTGYRIEVSDDASNWTSIYSTSTGDGAIDDLTGLSGAGRYIRMYGVQRACDGCTRLYGFSLWEFEVYANGSISPTRGATPTTVPQGTVTKAPTPTGGACYVKVAGYLYNLHPVVGIKLIDPNTGKTQTHSASTFKCSTTIATAIDMTNTYLSKHNGMGCAQRLAPYIVTPPAPNDPTCE